MSIYPTQETYKERLRERPLDIVESVPGVEGVVGGDGGGHVRHPQGAGRDPAGAIAGGGGGGVVVEQFKLIEVGVSVELACYGGLVPIGMVGGDTKGPWWVKRAMISEKVGNRGDSMIHGFCFFG